MKTSFRCGFASCFPFATNKCYHRPPHGLGGRQLLGTSVASPLLTARGIHLHRGGRWRARWFATGMQNLSNSSPTSGSCVCRISFSICTTRSFVCKNPRFFLYNLKNAGSPRKKVPDIEGAAPEINFPCKDHAMQSMDSWRIGNRIFLSMLALSLLPANASLGEDVKERSAEVKVRLAAEYERLE